MKRQIFDADMTYWQSLRIVARGLIQCPVRSGEWEEFTEGLRGALYYGTSPFLRLLAMIFLPVSAPIFAWLVQVERRRIAASKEAMRARIHAQYQPIDKGALDESKPAQEGSDA